MLTIKKWILLSDGRMIELAKLKKGSFAVVRENHREYLLNRNTWSNGSEGMYYLNKYLIIDSCDSYKGIFKKHCYYVKYIRPIVNNVIKNIVADINVEHNKTFEEPYSFEKNIDEMIKWLKEAKQRGSKIYCVPNGFKNGLELAIEQFKDIGSHMVGPIMYAGQGGSGYHHDLWYDKPSMKVSDYHEDFEGYKDVFTESDMKVLDVERIINK